MILRVKQQRIYCLVLCLGIVGYIVQFRYELLEQLCTSVLKCFLLLFQTEFLNRPYAFSIIWLWQGIFQFSSVLIHLLFATLIWLSPVRRVTP